MQHEEQRVVAAIQGDKIGSPTIVKARKRKALLDGICIRKERRRCNRSFSANGTASNGIHKSIERAYIFLNVADADLYKYCYILNSTIKFM